MHDLSIFVGREHLNTCTQTQIDDPSIMCYGSLPNPVLDEYTELVKKKLDMHDTIFEPLQKSLSNAIPKYNKTKDPASVASLVFARALSYDIHPTLVTKIDARE